MPALAINTLVKDFILTCVTGSRRIFFQEVRKSKDDFVLGSSNSNTSAIFIPSISASLVCKERRQLPCRRQRAVGVDIFPCLGVDHR